MSSTTQNPADPSPADRAGRLLVFNCHEAWVHQLGGLDRPMDVIVDLSGRFKRTWDEQMRPLPPNARIVTLERVLASPEPYYCIIAHNISDLLDVKLLPGPRLVVIHSTLEGRAREENSKVSPEKLSAMLKQYLALVAGHAVPCSLLKGRSWGFTDDIVPFAVNADDYPPHVGDVPAGLRISNHIKDRAHILMWDFHAEAFGDLPVHLVGHNPDNPDLGDVHAADNWADLKHTLSRHRFYIHTARTDCEDGYNMATLEAMAAGLPVLGNRHPTSPIVDGVSGFLSDDPAELHRRAAELLADADLAAQMGQAARQTAIEKFPMSAFRQAFSRSIETARAKHAGRTPNP